MKDNVGSSLHFTNDPYNLNNLEILDPKKIQDFVQEINAIPSTETRKLIIAIGTGGTISMKQVEKKGKVFFTPELDFKDIFKKTDISLQEKFIVKSFDAYSIDSSQMRYSHVHDLAIFMLYVSQHIQKDFLGFLILHGTDTMAEAASHTAMQMGAGLPFPIVYTGAQKPISMPLSDAGINITHSLYALEGMKQHSIGEVVIVFGDAVLFAAGAKKVSSNSRNAFDTINHELLVDLSIPQHPLHFSRWIREKNKNKPPFTPKIYSGYSHLLEINSKMSRNPEQIKRQIDDEAILGILLVTHGSGTTDPDIARAISEVVRKRNIPAFSISPVHSDLTNALYEIGIELVQLGIYPLFMTDECMRAKFEYALRACGNTCTGNPVDCIVGFMKTQFIGEIPTEESLRHSSLLRI